MGEEGGGRPLPDLLLLRETLIFNYTPAEAPPLFCFPPASHSATRRARHAPVKEDGERRAGVGNWREERIPRLAASTLLAPNEALVSNGARVRWRARLGVCRFSFRQEDSVTRRNGGGGGRNERGSGRVLMKDRL